MRGMNRVTLIGSVGADPEIRYMNDGRAVANIRLATSESWTDKASGARKEKTEWHRLVAFGPTAEIAQKYVAKGAPLCVEGKIQTRKYEKDGVTHYATEIMVAELILLGQDRSDMRPAAPEPARRPSANANSANRPRQPAPAEDFDDEIPF